MDNFFYIIETDTEPSPINFYFSDSSNILNLFPAKVKKERDPETDPIRLKPAPVVRARMFELE
jgi:hypothetical protein